MNRGPAFGHALGPVPVVDTVRFIFIAMLSSKVFTPSLSEPLSVLVLTGQPHF